MFWTNCSQRREKLGEIRLSTQKRTLRSDVRNVARAHIEESGFPTTTVEEVFSDEEEVNFVSTIIDSENDGEDPFIAR